MVADLRCGFVFRFTRDGMNCEHPYPNLTMNLQLSWWIIIYQDPTPCDDPMDIPPRLTPIEIPLANHPCTPEGLRNSDIQQFNPNAFASTPSTAIPSFSPPTAIRNVLQVHIIALTHHSLQLVETIPITRLPNNININFLIGFPVTPLVLQPWS